MKKLHLLLVLCMMNIAAYALNGPCTPGGVGSGYSGTTAYCIGATATPITFNYSECSVGTGSPTGVSCNATWYYNTTSTNVISGGTVTVSGPTAFTSAAGSNGDLPTFTPSTAATGTRYYFCRVTWTDAGTCTSPYTTPVVMVKINPNPASITGTTSVCEGATTTFHSATGGGMAWTSSDAGVATVGSTNGIVTGVAAGNAVITYTLLTGCYSIKSITVNTTPASITGTFTACVGSTTDLDNTTPSGTWTSSNAAVATVGSGTGIVTGVAGGTAKISYSLSTGCRQIITATVYPIMAITGTAVMCEGATTTLADATAGGTWSTSAPGIATVGTSGIVTGVAAGNADITYTAASGCYKVKQVTVNTTPAAIGNTPAIICAGANTTLTDGTSGGTWSSSNGAIATVGTGGLVTGVAAGTARISYNMSTGCRAVTIATVNALPATITGSLFVCEGQLRTLASTTTGGTWSSTNTGIADIGSSTGIVSGVAAGAVTISYILPTTCYRAVAFTVRPLPAAIVGTPNVCPGTTATLTDPTGAGSWTSSTPANATIGMSTGIVTGVAAGTSTITFTYSNTCYTTTTASVTALPTSITGTFTVCIGATTTLSSDVGGTWTSSNTAKATVGSSTGVVTGVTAGSAYITYTHTSGCRRVQAVTVNGNPVAIGGASNVCVGTTTTLTDASSGGTWSSSDALTATVGTSGIVSGVAPGNVTISYIVGTGCYATKSMTVVTAPAASTGTLSVCAGTTTTLSNATPGGTWSSSATGVATVVAATGVVTGVTAGNANITYSIGTGCFDVEQVTVNAAPATITGMNKVCVDLTTTLNCATVGGTWSSSDGAIGSIGSSSGIVTGITAGVINITYTLATGCHRQLLNFNVYPNPAAITGTFLTCPATTTTLASTTTGGNWASSNTGVATVAVSTGVVTGVAGGTSTIYYTLATGCRTQQDVTINAAPAAITGTKTVCAGLTTTLADATSGGEWSSADDGIATVGSSDGVVTGASGGTVRITYTTPAAGCFATTIVTVVTSPAAITGTATMCVGYSTTLADATTGGSWSSSDGAIATVGTSTGVVTGVSAGNAYITYSLGASCYSTKQATVNAVTAITGTLNVCIGATTTLNNATTGGVWVSSNGSIATIGSSSGVATGVATGTVNITYTPPSGCAALAVLTVNSSPAVITGTTNMCVGLTTTLNCATSGGTWSSSAPGFFTVGSADGVVSAVSAGSGTISYTVGTGCTRTTSFVSNPNPAAITGVASVCEGTTTVLSSASSGSAIWSSSDDGTATIGSSSGVVTGVVAGNATITYTLLAGSCYTTQEVTVNPTPDPIGGTLSLCVGATTNLTNPDAGTWASSNTSVATIGTGGIATGLTAGTANITFTLTGTGCKTISVLTVNAPPAAISGANATCVGGSTTFTDGTTGGTWTSNNVGIATVGSSTGLVSGVGAGNTTITYTVTATGCYATKAVTVLTSPAAITGGAVVCVGQTTTLADATTGGTWSSDATGVATVGSATGVVTGVSGGNANIVYSLGGGCSSTIEVTVNALPASITGTMTVCVGGTTDLDNTDAGGTWSSGNTGKATVGSATGIVTGVASGTVNITYLHTNGCPNSVVVTVNPIAAITGTASTCIGGTTTLSNTTSGGTWSSSNTAKGTIGSTTGIVTGIANGTTTISYTITATGCAATRVVTVNDAPASITYSGTVCIGNATTLSNASTGGTWSSSNTARATVVSTTGVVTGVSAGTVNITYSTGAGAACIATTELTVNTNAAAITGTTNACVGLTSTLADATTGGTWSSSNGAIATVGSDDGVVSAVSAGTITITYTLASGCYKTTSFTAKAVPVAISGTAEVCVGATTALTDATSGGTSWTSSTPAKATISGSGIVTGVASGNSTITYTITNGCYATKQVTVDALPATFTGSLSVCKGLTTTLSSDGTGTWTSSNAAVATVGSATGIVTGVNGGTATISYTYTGTGCRRTAIASVNPTVTISGNTSLCEAATTTLSVTLTGGAWSTSDASVATVGTSGVVTGVLAGNVNITYTSVPGCIMAKAMTVNAMPTAITGTASVCATATTTLASTPSGGAWSSSAPATATVSGGVVTGVTAGNANISYTLTGGCYVLKQATINALPAAITGTTNVCVGNNTTLADATTGGTWESSNATVGTVGSATGVVSGLVAGTTSISYTLTATGCRRMATVVVNPLPAAITGTAMVCPGTTTVMSDATGGGASWSSSIPAKATIGSSSGLVTGIATGTTSITYTLSTGCYATQEVTVNPNPAAFTPTTNVLCQGFTVDLDPGTAGGTWSSTNTAVATVGSAEGDGVVTGQAGATVTISYIMTATGCYVTRQFTVNSNAVTTGTLSVCEGSTTTLANGTSGGVWSSTVTGVATIGTDGVVSGISAGNSDISYLHASTGCYRIVEVTVNALPAAIGGGDAIICVSSSSSAFTDATAGGTWSSSNDAVATIGTSDAIANGNSGGVVTITYTSAEGCNATTQMTVGPYSGIVSGPTSVDEDATIALTASVGGGTWSSDDVAIATVDASGVVTGTNGGGGNSVNIYYQTNMGACGVSTTTYTITVNVARPGGGAVTSANGGLSMNVAVHPNPNPGVFTIKGSFATTEDRELSLEMTDVLGHIVYKDVVTAKAGSINIPVMLNNNPANGIYLLTVKSGTERKVFQVVIKQ